MFFLAPFQLFDQLYNYHATTGSIRHVRNVGNEITDQDYGRNFPSSVGYDPLGRLVGAVGPWQPDSLCVLRGDRYQLVGEGKPHRRGRKGAPRYCPRSLPAERLRVHRVGRTAFPA